MTNVTMSCVLTDSAQLSSIDQRPVVLIWSKEANMSAQTGAEIIQERDIATMPIAIPLPLYKRRVAGAEIDGAYVTVDGDVLHLEDGTKVVLVSQIGRLDGPAILFPTLKELTDELQECLAAASAVASAFPTPIHSEISKPELDPATRPAPPEYLIV